MNIAMASNQKITAAANKDQGQIVLNSSFPWKKKRKN